jgi:hypothetical protein
MSDGLNHDDPSVGRAGAARFNLRAVLRPLRVPCSIHYRLHRYHLLTRLALTAEASLYILEGPIDQTQNQNDNRVMWANLCWVKSFTYWQHYHGTMKTARFCSFTSHLHDMQYILATAMTLQVFIYISKTRNGKQREKIVLYHARRVRPWSRLMGLSAQ